MDTAAAHYFPDTAVARAGPSPVAIQRFLGLLFLNLFVLTSWFSSLALFFSAAVSEPLGAMIGLYGVMLYPVLLFIAVVFLESGNRIVPLNKQHVLIFGGTILFLAAYGVLRGNSARIIVLDCFAFSTVLGGYILGRRDDVWRAIRPLIVLLLAISVFCAFVFTSPLVLIDRTILVTQPGSHFEAVLVFAPLFCMVAAFERQRLWFYLLLALSIGSFLVYLYFGRR